MDLPKILLTGLVFLFFLVFLEFLGSWAWDSKNLEKNQINQKNQSWMDLPKILLTGLFFLFFLVFLEFLDSWAWDSKNLEKNQINQKNQSWMDLPKILLTGLFFLFFLVFLEFLDSWAWDNKKPEQKQKNTQKQSWMDLLKILLTGLIFLFWYKSRNFSNEKNKVEKQVTKIKRAKTQRSQRGFLNWKAKSSSKAQFLGSITNFPGCISFPHESGKSHLAHSTPRDSWKKIQAVCWDQVVSPEVGWNILLMGELLHKLRQSTFHSILYRVLLYITGGWPFFYYPWTVWQPFCISHIIITYAPEV